MAQSVYPGSFGGGTAVGSRVRWGSVIAGVITAMIVQVVLTLLGLAIGLNTFDPDRGGFSGVGSGFWLFITTLLAAFTGGWVASSLANVSTRLDGLMHGVLSWGVFMVLAAYLIGTGLGAMVGGVFNLASSAVTGATQGVVQRTEGAAAVREQPQQPQAPAASPAERIRTQIGEAGRNIVSERTADAAARAAADAAARATWGIFFILVLSLIASAFGGLRGLKVSDYRQEIGP